MKSLFPFVFSLGIFAFSQCALASACCGGGLTDSMIILGGQKSHMSASYSHSILVVDHVDSRGIWQKRDEHQIVETFTFDYAQKLSPLWQGGITLPIIKREWIDNSYSNIGDLGLFVGRDFNYDSPSSAWIPRSLLIFHLTLPTGKNRAESDVGGLDSSGNGFWSTGVGILFTKNFDSLDVWSRLRLHHSFEKNYSNSTSQGRLDPGWGGDLGFGVGYNIRQWRWGALVRSNYEDAVKVTGSVNAPGAPERMSTFSLTADYTYQEEWVFGGQVFDQTLLGSPANTSLGRGLSLSVLKKIR